MPHSYGRQLKREAIIDIAKPKTPFEHIQIAPARFVTSTTLRTAEMTLLTMTRRRPAKGIVAAMRTAHERLIERPVKGSILAAQ